MTVAVLTLPGWQNSGPGHWMTLWEARHPDWRRVEQADWEQPRRSDWIAALDAQALRTSGPLMLVAHSLGCLTVAHWAATATDAARIRHALLRPTSNATILLRRCPTSLRLRGCNCRSPAL